MNYRIEKVGLFRRYKPLYDTKNHIVPGSSVKLVFKLTDKSAEVNAERLWIDVTKVSHDGKHLEGTIDNDPLYVDLRYGDAIEFEVSNIFDIDNS